MNPDCETCGNTLNSVYVKNKKTMVSWTKIQADMDNSYLTYTCMADCKQTMILINQERAKRMMEKRR